MPHVGATVEEVLRAAGIPLERQGRARVARLSPAERLFYLWILRGFATAAPPSAAATRVAAADFGLDHGQVLKRLADEDLVHVDSAGTPTVAYPFSANLRGHHVTINRKEEVQAMCAIDALGISPMLDLPVEVVSHDPVSGGEVRVHLRPGDQAKWRPEDAVVLAGSVVCAGPSFQGCCDVLNFFETPANAHRYLREHPEATGMPISIPDAVGAGRAVFADVLKEG